MDDDKSGWITAGLITVFLLGVLSGVVFFSVFNENVDERAAVNGVATGVFRYDGHYYAYDVVIDTAKTDSLNAWRRLEK